MANRTLITYLGTGGGKRTKGIASQTYRQTVYRMPDGTLTEKSPFVGLVLNKQIDCNEIKIFGSVGSMWPTLLDYLIDKNNIENDLYNRLVEKVWDLHEKPELEQIKDEISDCFSSLLGKKTEILLHDRVDTETRMWSFFDLLASVIKDSDIVFMDITHGFRHLPIIGITALSYISTIYPNIILQGLYYAMFESKINPNDESEPAPILDLLPAWDMLQWFHASRDYIVHGNASDLVSKVKPIKPNLAKSLKGINDTLRLTFIETLDTRFSNMKKEINRSEIAMYPQLKYLTKYLDEMGNLFPEGQPEWKNQIQISFWFYEHAMYQQALTSIVEGIKSYAMIKVGLDWKDRELRDSFPKEQFRGGRKKSQILGDELAKLYIKANKWRNEVNHGGLLFKEASSMTKSVMDEIDRVFQNPFLDDLLKK